MEHITPKGGNIFADLGFEPEEAANLLNSLISGQVIPRCDFASCNALCTRPTLTIIKVIGCY